MLQVAVNLIKEMHKLTKVTSTTKSASKKQTHMHKQQI